jgi:hypothetical protein
MLCGAASPADFGGVNLPLPRTTGESLPFRGYFFHSFPFPKGDEGGFDGFSKG